MFEVKKKQTIEELDCAFSYHERQNGGRHFERERLDAALAQIRQPFVERCRGVVRGPLLLPRGGRRRHLRQNVLEKAQNDGSCTRLLSRLSRVLKQRQSQAQNTNKMYQPARG